MRHSDLWWKVGEVRRVLRGCQSCQLHTSADSLPEVGISGILNYYYSAFQPFLIARISLSISSVAYVSGIFSPLISRGQPFLPHYHSNHIAPSFVYFLFLLRSFPSSFRKSISSLLTTWSDRPMSIYLLLSMLAAVSALWMIQKICIRFDLTFQFRFSVIKFPYSRSCCYL